jgi:hypothetical protein
MVDANGEMLQSPSMTSSFNGAHAFYKTDAKGGVFRMQCNPPYERNNSGELNTIERGTPVPTSPWMDVLEIRWEP